MFKRWGEYFQEIIRKYCERDGINWYRRIKDKERGIDIQEMKTSQRRKEEEQ